MEIEVGTPVAFRDEPYEVLGRVVRLFRCGDVLKCELDTLQFGLPMVFVLSVLVPAKTR